MGDLLNAKLDEMNKDEAREWLLKVGDNPMNWPHVEPDGSWGKLYNYARRVKEDLWRKRDC